MNLGVGNSKCLLFEWSNKQIKNKSNLTGRQVNMLDDLVKKNLWSWELVEDNDQTEEKVVDEKNACNKSDNSSDINIGIVHVDHGCDNISIVKDENKNFIATTSSTGIDNRSSSTYVIKSETKKRKSLENSKKPPKKTVKKIKALSKRQMAQQMDVDWYESFGQLMIYEETYGTYQVPIDYEIKVDDKIIQLGNWLNIQGLFLDEYKEDNPEWYANLMSLVETGKLSFDNDDNDNHDNNDHNNNDHDHDQTETQHQSNRNDHNSSSSSSSSRGSSSSQYNLNSTSSGSTSIPIPLRESITEDQEKNVDGDGNVVKEGINSIMLDLTHTTVTINQSKQADRLDPMQSNHQSKSQDHHYHQQQQQQQHQQQQHTNSTQPPPPPSIVAHTQQKT